MTLDKQDGKWMILELTPVWLSSVDAAGRRLPGAWRLISMDH